MGFAILAVVVSLLLGFTVGKRYENKHPVEVSKLSMRDVRLQREDSSILRPLTPRSLFNS
jgi:hypothetical protein